MNEENVPDDGIHRSLGEMRKAAIPGELRDECGIKQPSHTPPFWAAAPGRTSKKRGKR